MREDNELFHKFKELEDHPGYGINALGEVINFNTGRILKPDSSNRGYERVTLDGQKYYIHRLVAENLVPNPNNRNKVTHVNGNNSDNFFRNLRWIN